MERDWSDERYVKLYIRDEPEWASLPWWVRGLFYELLRKVDPSGALKLGKAGRKAIAAAIHATDSKMLKESIEALLEDGAIQLIDSENILLIPNFVYAQEAKQSNLARQKKRRERLKALKEIATPPTTSSAPKSIYFVQKGGKNGPIKIGITENVAQRITDLQSASEEALRLLCCIDNRTERDELIIHSMFYKERIRGEWFRPSKELLEYIDSVTPRDTPRDTSPRATTKKTVTPRDDHEASTVTPRDETPPKSSRGVTNGKTYSLRPGIPEKTIARSDSLTDQELPVPYIPVRHAVSRDTSILSRREIREIGEIREVDSNRVCVPEGLQGNQISPEPPEASPSSKLSGNTHTHSETRAPKVGNGISEVFNHWRSVMELPTARLTKKRTAFIQSRLNDYTHEQLTSAIDGATHDDWIMGRDPKVRAGGFRDIEHVLKDDATIERLIGLCGQHTEWREPEPEPIIDPPGTKYIGKEQMAALKQAMEGFGTKGEGNVE